MFLLNIDQSDLSRHLADWGLNILRDIYQVLKVPHAAQELLSAERTPTLSLALPVYEILIDTWKSLRGIYAHAMGTCCSQAPCVYWGFKQSSPPP